MLKERSKLYKETQFVYTNGAEGNLGSIDPICAFRKKTKGLFFFGKIS